MIRFASTYRTARRRGPCGIVQIDLGVVVSRDDVCFPRLASTNLPVSGLIAIIANARCVIRSINSSFATPMIGARAPALSGGVRSE